MSLRQDLRFGCRMLLRSPGFTIVATLTLALGIGANTAIFSYVDGVLLKPLPYGHPERICMVWEKPPGFERNGISTLNYLDWAHQNTVFDRMAARRGDSVTMTGIPKPIQLRAARVSAGFFDIFGVAAALGRTFAPDEDQRGKPHVAVLSNRLWKNQFGGAKDILGRKILLDSEPYTVIGVLPADSAFDRQFNEIWLPLVFEPKDMTRNYHWFISYARLKEGVTIDEARSQMKVIGERIAKRYPDSNKGWGVTVDRFEDRVVGDDLRRSLYILLGAVAAVLLIACANLANLTLARGTSREREVAIRASLGAGRWRLMRQFLAENVVLSLAGGVLGLGLAFAMVAGLNALTPPFTLPSEAVIRIDARVLMFTLAISVVTGIIFGIAPALQAASPKLAETIKEGGRGTTAGGARGRLRSALVIAETALAFILLTGAGLLIRSFDALMNVHTGFDATNVLTMDLPLSPTRVVDGDQATLYTRRVLEAAGALPGIRDVAITTALPLQGWSNGMPFQIVGKPFKDRANRDACAFKMVSPSYFRALGIRVERGRGLEERDMKNSRPVTVINETMAKRFFKDENPVGRRIDVQEIVYGKPNLGPEIPWEVVGVITDEKLNGLDDNRSPAMYVSYSQSPSQYVSLVVKSAANPEAMQQAILAAVQQINPDQALPNVRTLERIERESTGPNRLRTTLMAVFAAIAMMLAAIGIYGVISYSVAQRTHEMGVRSALGASAGAILQLVIRGGMTRVAVGLGIGACGALALTRTMKSLLFEVSTWDPWTLGAVALGLIAVGAMACYAPARRATKVDPMVALRYE